jgi:predicted NBD/HSP70 family sugar kinase
MDAIARAAVKPRKTEGQSQSLATILTLVRSGEAATRHDLETVTGLGRAVVVDRLATLSELGLIEEGELGVAQGGRAPRLVRFRATAGLVLVAFLDRTTLGVGAADLSGRLRIEHYEAADLSVGPERILERLGTLFDWVLEQRGDGAEVWGIGLAVPGPVEMTGGAAGEPSVPHVPRWKGYPVVDHLTARHGAPVWVRSNVEAMALGELKAGASARDMVFMKLGQGITVGLISNGRLHRGASGGAGQIGHVATGIESATLCSCGRTDCLEVVCGAAAIAREGTAGGRDGRSRLLGEILERGGEVTASDVGLAAQQGDPFSVELIQRCGRIIGTALATLANLFNPALIVIGGAGAQADSLLAAIRETVYRQSHPLVTRDLRIVRSQMGNSGGMIGAAAQVVDDLFAIPALEGWVALGSAMRRPEVEGLVARARLAMRGEERPRPPLAR